MVVLLGTSLPPLVPGTPFGEICVEIKGVFLQKKVVLAVLKTLLAQNGFKKIDPKVIDPKQIGVHVQCPFVSFNTFDEIPTERTVAIKYPVRTDEEHLLKYISDQEDLQIFIFYELNQQQKQLVPDIIANNGGNSMVTFSQAEIPLKNFSLETRNGSEYEIYCVTEDQQQIEVGKIQFSMVFSYFKEFQPISLVQLKKQEKERDDKEREMGLESFLSPPMKKKENFVPSMKSPKVGPDTERLTKKITQEIKYIFENPNQKHNSGKNVANANEKTLLRDDDLTNADESILDEMISKVKNLQKQFFNQTSYVEVKNNESEEEEKKEKKNTKSKSKAKTKETSSKSKKNQKKQESESETETESEEDSIENEKEEESKRKRKKDHQKRQIKKENRELDEISYDNLALSISSIHSDSIQLDQTKDALFTPKKEGDKAERSDTESDDDSLSDYTVGSSSDDENNEAVQSQHPFVRPIFQNPPTMPVQIPITAPRPQQVQFANFVPQSQINPNSTQAQRNMQQAQQNQSNFNQNNMKTEENAPIFQFLCHIVDVTVQKKPNQNMSKDISSLKLSFPFNTPNSTSKLSLASDDFFFSDEKKSDNSLKYALDFLKSLPVSANTQFAQVIQNPKSSLVIEYLSNQKVEGVAIVPLSKCSEVFISDQNSKKITFKHENAEFPTILFQNEIEIKNFVSNKIVGSVQLLLACGTLKQIQNLLASEEQQDSQEEETQESQDSSQNSQKKEQEIPQVQEINKKQQKPQENVQKQVPEPIIQQKNDKPSETNEKNIQKPSSKNPEIQKKQEFDNFEQEFEQDQPEEEENSNNHNLIPRKLFDFQSSLTVFVSRACGLQEAGILASQRDPRIIYASRVGLNIFVKLESPLFKTISNSNNFQTQICAESFSPIFNYEKSLNFKLDDEIFANFAQESIRFSLWHRLPQNQQNQQQVSTKDKNSSDLEIFIGETNIPLAKLVDQNLNFLDQGVKGWFPVLQNEKNNNKSNVGAIELFIRFDNQTIQSLKKLFSNSNPEENNEISTFEIGNMKRSKEMSLPFEICRFTLIVEEIQVPVQTLKDNIPLFFKQKLANDELSQSKYFMKIYNFFDQKNSNSISESSVFDSTTSENEENEEEEDNKSTISNNSNNANPFSKKKNEKPSFQSRLIKINEESVTNSSNLLRPDFTFEQKRVMDPIFVEQLKQTVLEIDLFAQLTSEEKKKPIPKKIEKRVKTSLDFIENDSYDEGIQQEENEIWDATPIQTEIFLGKSFFPLFPITQKLKQGERTFFIGQNSTLIHPKTKNLSQGQIKAKIIVEMIGDPESFNKNKQRMSSSFAERKNWTQNPKNNQNSRKSNNPENVKPRYQNFDSDFLEFQENPNPNLRKNNINDPNNLFFDEFIMPDNAQPSDLPFIVNEKIKVPNSNSENRNYNNFENRNYDFESDFSGRNPNNSNFENRNYNNSNFESDFSGRNYKNYENPKPKDTFFSKNYSFNVPEETEEIDLHVSVEGSDVHEQIANISKNLTVLEDRIYEFGKKPKQI